MREGERGKGSISSVFALLIDLILNKISALEFTIWFPEGPSLWDLVEQQEGMGYRDTGARYRVRR